MSWPFPLRSQVVENFRQSGTEKLPPQTIYEYASSQRVVMRNDPVGQVQTSGRAFGGFQVTQESGDGRLHDRSRIVHPVSARQQASLTGRHRLGDKNGWDLGILNRPGRFQLFQFNKEGLQFWSRPLEV